MPMDPVVGKMVAQAVLAAGQQQAQPQAPNIAPYATPADAQATQAAQASQAPAQEQAVGADAPIPNFPQSALNAYGVQQSDALEKQLKAADLAEDAAALQTGSHRVAVPPSLQPGGELTGDALAKKADQAAAAGISETRHNAQLKRKTALDNAVVDSKIAEGTQADADTLAHRVDAGYRHMEQVQQQLTEQANQTWLNWKVANDEMMKMAQAKPQDVFGHAHVNSVLGRIAIFFGGLSPDGHPRGNSALDHIETLATQSILQQKMRFEHLQAIGEGNRTMYGQLVNRLGSEQAATTVMQNMAREAYKTQVQVFANKFQSPRAQIAANIEIAKASDEQNKSLEDLRQHQVNNLLQASQIAGQEQALATVADTKALAGHKEQRLAGFVGYVPKDEHARLAKVVGGARTLIDAINRVENRLKSGNRVVTPSMYRQAMVDDAALLKGARDWLETGTRIEGGEQSTIDAIKTAPAEQVIAWLVGGEFFGTQAQIDAIRQAVTSSTYHAVHAAAPATTEMDSTDPVFGHYHPRTYKGPMVNGSVRSRIERGSGTLGGHSVLEGARGWSE